MTNKGALITGITGQEFAILTDEITQAWSGQTYASLQIRVSA